MWLAEMEVFWFVKTSFVKNNSVDQPQLSGSLISFKWKLDTVIVAVQANVPLRTKMQLELCSNPVYHLILGIHCCVSIIHSNAA